MRSLMVWAIFVLAAVLVVIMQLSRPASSFTTDIFTLLPAARHDPLLAEAQAVSRDAFFREVLILVEAPDRASVVAAARQVSDALARFDWIGFRDSREASNALQQSYLDNGFALLTGEDRDALATDASASFRNQVLARLARPGDETLYSLQQDPGGYISRFVTSLPRPYPAMQPTDTGFARVVDNRHYRLLVARLEAAEFDPDRQQALAGTLATALTDDCTGCMLTWTGAIRFASAARESAERDIRLIGGLSITLILVLFIGVFRQVRALACCLLPLLTGAVGGLAATLLVFGQVHVLTLVFGTTLLGLIIDYVFHFLVHRWSGGDGKRALRQVLPALSLGLATSLTAFAFLLFAGFPALTQLAVFSTAGLLGGWLTVTVILPHLPVGNVDGAARITRLAEHHQHWVAWKRGRYVLLLAGFIAALAGIAKLEVTDDVRDLQATPTRLLDQDRAIRQSGGRVGSADFILITGDSTDQRLAREEALFASTDENGFGLSRFLPSAERRRQNIDHYQPLFQPDQENSAIPARTILEAAGYRDAVISAYLDSWQAQSNRQASTDEWLKSLQATGLDHLVVETDVGTAHIARIDALDSATASNLAEKIQGARYVQPLQHLQELFAEIRWRAVIAVAAAYLLVVVGLALRYGMRGALMTLLPGTLGGLLAVGALGLAGLPLTVFSLMGIILVLGIGADYSLFLRESRERPAETGLAISLAAVTTLFSFGLLVLSSVPALVGFGLAVATGISGAYLAAPLCADLDREMAK